MKLRIILLFLILNSIVDAQQNLQSTHVYFRDRLFETNRAEKYTGNSFLPVNESDYDIQKFIKDTTVQYYELYEVLYKKHIIEIKAKDCYLTISPVIDLTYGTNVLDTGKFLYQNTRGFLVEGDLFKNFSFATTFYENQARFSRYENDYMLSRGEYYPTNTGYSQDNAVVPGAMRTKDFRYGAFDYAYALGYISYRPIKNLSLYVGNNQQFIGSGYRSVLLSDNSVGAPYFRADYQISKKWSFNYLRTRNLNLIRKKYKTTVEAYYQPKGLAVNYLSYRASDKLHISLFEGAIWQMGDSLATKRANILFYNPIPFIATFLKDKTVFAIQGLNVNYVLNNYIRLYSQFALSSFNRKNFAFQIGSRFSDLFKIKSWMLQAEYNIVSPKMFEANFDRMSYSQYNLPLAHTKGAGFHEAIIRSSFEKYRFYADIKSVTYFLNHFSTKSLLPVVKNETIYNDIILLNQIEIGYRFNKKLNLCLFGNVLYRQQMGDLNQKTLVFQIGMKTGLINHYNDY
jgi:hypothetical protein